MGSAMPTHEDLAELAKICARHARGATDKEVATVLWKMAEDYQTEAVKLDSGQSPDIGERLPVFNGVLLALAQ
jgi:hypothetical protein